MNQSLQTSHPYPAQRTFVVKLHRDAELAAGELRGRVVHLATDQRADFADAAGLVSCLLALTQASLLHDVPRDC